jgi:hypothetical protein
MLMARRYHGTLDSITDSSHHHLRSIRASAYEVAMRTDRLLTELTAVPGVRIFQGLHPAHADGPRIPHAISSGRRLLLVESVAWPPGRYVAAADGRIFSDGSYIGQSVDQLMTAVRQWQRLMPVTHRVGALVVVHPTNGEPQSLPTPGGELSWSRAADVVQDVRARLLRPGHRVSRSVVVVLSAATLPLA